MKTTITTLICIFMLNSCGIDPISNNNSNGNPSIEFQYAWQFLKVFFIYQDRLPRAPFEFPGPSSLYASVNEPYTAYYPPDSVGNIIDILNSTTYGLGVIIDSVSMGYVIDEVFPNSPAQASGLQTNDTILTINSIPLAEVPFEQMPTLLNGNVGETKRLTIKRDSGVLEKQVTIAAYVTPTVFSDSLDSNIAYIRITSFFSRTTRPGGTAEEFDAALKKTSWATITVLDLQDNPGGEIEPAIEVASEFLAEGTPIVQTIERRLIPGTNEGITTDSTWRALDIGGDARTRNFYILQNRNTASAAELLISGLTNNRPEIVTVGERSFGKGRGQIISFTPDSGLAQVTYALISPIQGQSYDDLGIVPSVVLNDQQDAIEVVVDTIEQTLVKSRATQHIATINKMKLNKKLVPSPLKDPMCIRFTDNFHYVAAE